MCTKLISLVFVLTLALVSVSYGGSNKDYESSVVIGDWEQSADNWQVSGGIVIFTYSHTGATLNDWSLMLVGNAGSWSWDIHLPLQDPNVDLMDWFMANCDYNKFKMDITLIAADWIEDGDPGTDPYIAMKMILNAGGFNADYEWAGIWYDAGDVVLPLDETTHCVWDISDGKAQAQAIFDAGYTAYDQYVEIYLIPQNSGYLSPVTYYLDYARLVSPLNLYIPGDINKDGYVDFFDFAEFALNWLKCNNMADPSCTWEP